MKKAAPTLILLFLTVFAACSTPETRKPRPPDFLLKKEAPLSKPAVETTQDIVDRLLRAESAHETLRAKFNILVDWISPTES